MGGKMYLNEHQPKNTQHAITFIQISSQIKTLNEDVPTASRQNPPLFL